MRSLAKCILFLFVALAYAFALNAPVLACNMPYFLRNGSNMAIIEFHLKDNNSTFFSDDLLDGAINPQNSRTISINANGDFDAIFRMSNQKYYEIFISDICANNTINIYNSGMNIKISVQ